MARLIARKEIIERESTYQGWKFPRILNQLSTVQVIINYGDWPPKETGIQNIGSQRLDY